MGQTEDEKKQRRIADILSSVSQRINAGTPIEFDAILASNPDIADQLRSEFARRAFDPDATDMTSPLPSLAATNEGSPSTIEQGHSPTRDGLEALLERLSEAPPVRGDADRF